MKRNFYTLIVVVASKINTCSTKYTFHKNLQHEITVKINTYFIMIKIIKCYDSTEFGVIPSDRICKN